MNQTQYQQHARQADSQLHPHQLTPSQDSSRGSLGLQVPSNTFERTQQIQHHGEAWSQNNNFAQQQVAHGDIQHQQDNEQSQPAYGSGKGSMSLNLHNVTTAAIGSSQRNNSSAKHSQIQRSQDQKAGGGFFGATSADREQMQDHPAQESNTAIANHFLNKTQMIVDSTKSSINERANRINLHRSNRQRSHQSHHGTNQRAQPTAGQENSGVKNEVVPDLSIKLKNKEQNQDAGFYQLPHQADSTKNSSSQHYRYAQPGEESEVAGSKSQLTQQEQQQYYNGQRIDNPNTAYSSVQQQNFKQQKDIQDGQDQINQQARQQQQQQTYAPNYKKKVQPHQPRSREESRRKGAGGGVGHNKSSETTNSWEQSSQNSSQCQQQQVQQNTYQANQKIDVDKFSQLVCQVPQGKTSPQMGAQQAQQQNIQVHDASMNFGNQYLLGPQRANEAGRKTLVLDLDETLVHSSFKPVENADIMLPVEIDGQICTIYVLVRPYVAQFLKSLHKIYELVIFTASLSKYAEPLMSHLDPGKMCSYLLFREHCTYFNNAYVKDLTRLGRPMKDVIIVDNSPVAYLFQPENAIPAVSWYDEPSDMELQRIAVLLERLNQEDDVRKIIRSVIQNNKIDPRQEQLYLASSQHRRDKSQQVTRRSKHQKLTSNDLNAVPEQQAPQSAVQVQKVHQINYQQEQEPAQIQHHNQQQQQQQPNQIQQQQQQQQQQIQIQSQVQPPLGVQPNATHSRYDSSDTRQRNAALISEQLNQRKRCDSDNLNMEIVLSNVQKLTQQTKDLQYESEMKKSMHQNSKDIQQAYQHHKNQILQLQNEIAALKSQHTTTSDQTPRSQATAKANEIVVKQSANSRQQQQASQQTTQQISVKNVSKTTGQAQRVVHQQIGESQQHPDPRKASFPIKQGNKGQKQRADTGARAHQANYDGQNQPVVTQKPSAARQQRQSYKVLSSNEIQLVNYIKSGGQTSTNNTTATQRHPVHGAVEKKQIVVRESAGNNSQLHNTKQIIKLIKKTDGHQSNIDVSNSARKNFQQLEPSSTTAAQNHQAQGSQPNIGTQGSQQQANYSSRQQQHPATTKSQSKGHFAFSQQQPTQPGTSGHNHHNDRQRVTQQSSGQPFSGQINMMTSSHGQSRGQQASRQSSKTTKNYQVANQGSSNANGNIRTSYSSSKNSKPAAQSSLQTHDRISAGNVVVSGATGTTKRSSSVKSPATSSHHGNRKGSNGEQAARDPNVRKSNNTLQNGASSQAYGNLVSSYDQQPNGHHNRRERGSSAQPLYTGSNHSGNPLLVTNLVARPSSTTNKNKKVTSISATGNFHNLVLNGSHSTKHSTQNVSGQGTSAATGQQRGGSQDRHQKASSTTRHSSRVKGSTTNTTKTSSHNQTHHGHGHHQNDGKEEQQVRGSSKTTSAQQQFNLKQQQEHLQRMHQMTAGGNGGNVKQQLSATQRISPGTMLSLTTNGQQYVNHSGAGGQGQNSQNQLLDASLTPSNHQQHASALVKQNMKDIQVQDMLRLTQNTNAQGPPGYFNNGMSSTRNSKQAAQIAGNTSMQQPGPDDFLNKVKMQQQAGVKIVPGAEMQARHDGEPVKVKASAKGNVQVLQHQDIAISKSSQGHQSTGPSLQIKSPKYQNGNVPGSQTCASAAGGAQRDQQKILNDIMNMAVQREQKSGSAATSYGAKQVVMTTVGGGQAPTSGGHQIKKIRISSTQQSQNGRMSGQSNQSAPNHHKSTGMKRGDSNQSRGSHSGNAIHQVVRSSGQGQVKSRANEKDPQVRQAQLFNQTMKLKDTSDARAGNKNGGIISLLNELGEDQNSTAADAFLKSHNQEQFSQTQYLGTSSGNTGAPAQGQNQMGQSQLREVTRHFYNQLAQGGKKQQH